MSETGNSAPVSKLSSSPARGPPQVLVLSLARTGSGSMAAALRTLGYQHVYHGLDVVQESGEILWLERAAQASFLSLQCFGATRPKPFTRSDWDGIFDDFDVVTDLGAPFSLQLISAYPEAKVILIDRDIESWVDSFTKVIVEPLWPGRVPEALGRYMSWLAGSKDPVYFYEGLRQMYLGYFNASNPQELRANLRGVYKLHQQRIRDVVAPDRFLFYKLGDGWQPLCEFLGKETPPSTTPFPHRDTREDFSVMRDQILRVRLRLAAWQLFRYGVMAAIALVAVSQRKYLTLLARYWILH